MMRAKAMARPGLVCLVLSFPGVLAAAESGPLTTDVDCNDARYDDLQQFQAEVCTAHIGCARTFKAIDQVCKAKRFLGRIGDFFSPGKVLSSDEVLEAALPPLPDTPITRRSLAGARVAKPVENSTPKTSLTYDPSTRVASYYEGNVSNGLADGAGTTLSSNGSGAGGVWRAGKLDGPGLVKAANGDVMGGAFKDNVQQGEGFRATTNEPYVEGTYINGKPDGMMNVIYADGSTQRKLYRNGALLAEGARAPKGQQAVDPVYRTPEQIAAAEAEAFAGKLATAPSAGALYALADELAEKGDVARSRQSLRSLMTRFPTSPLAAKAADRIAVLGAATAPVANAPAQKSPASTAPPPAAAAPGGKLPAGMLEISLVDRLDADNRRVKLSVSVSQFEENERLVNACQARNFQAAECRMASASVPPYRYDAGGITPATRLGQKQNTGLAILCSFTPGSYSQWDTSQARPEDFCRAMLMAAIHEGMSTEVEFTRKGGQLFAAADVPSMAGANTGNCKADLAAVDREAGAARRRSPPNRSSEQFLQTSMYFAIQQARVLEGSCKGQPEAEGLLELKRVIGELYRDCALFKTDVSVCKPRMAY